MVSDTRKEEQGLIGCIIIDPECLGRVYDILAPEMFTETMAQNAYNAICLLFELGEKISIVTITNKMEDYQHDRNAIGQFLKNCLSIPETSTLCKQYASVIVNNYKVQKTRKVLSDIVFIPDKIDDQINATLGELEQLIDCESIAVESKSTVSANNKDLYFSPNKKKYIKTGFRKLDDIICGFSGGDTCVIGARPSVGKSALANQIINNIARNGYRVCYYNLEMMPNQLFERDIAQSSKITLNRLKTATSFADSTEMDEYNKAIDELSKMDVEVISGNVSISKLRSICKHRKYDIVFIDYLQLITSEKNYSNRVNEVGDISRAIKNLSIELDIPIVVLSQLNRECEHRPDKEPTRSDLRESGNIEQDASIVILLWDLMETGEFKGLKIDKSRQGKKGKICYKFDGNHVLFEEIQEDYNSFISKIETYKNSNVDKMRNPFSD